jgi:Ca2+-binding RTX toxin-like protein
MWIFLLMGTLMIGTMLGLGSASSEDDTDSDDDMSPEDIDILLGQSATGTEGDDHIKLIEGDPVDDAGPVTITGGDGDDLLDLFDPTASPSDIEPSSSYVYTNAFIDGGDGDDTISVSAYFSTINGGDGDDVINIFGVGGSSIFNGGDGNDTITGYSLYQDSTYIVGGAGDDVIDVTGMDNVGANGGTGDDHILVSGANQIGAGYNIFANGSEGEDTISFIGSAVTESDHFEAMSVHGGAGADLFELTFDEGGEIPTDRGIVITDPAVLDLIVLDDFVPGEDHISIEPTTLNSAFDITQARLEEDASTGTTELIISYESDTEIDREVVITINALGVSFDDITFVGVEEASLTAAAV